MNPIYIAYYSHENQVCYKIDLPWTQYRRETIVLCPVSDGYEKAKALAGRAILDHLSKAVQEEITNSVET